MSRKKKITISLAIPQELNETLNSVVSSYNENRPEDETELSKSELCTNLMYAGLTMLGSKSKQTKAKESKEVLN